MKPTSPNSTPLRWALLAFAVATLALVGVALACGPAQDGQDGGGATPTPTPYIIDGSSPSQLATAKAQPTATPLPPGYVWPTDLPTYTPIPSLPTLKAQMEQLSAKLRTEEAQAGVGGAAGEEPSLEDAQLRSVAKHVALGEYDAIARFRVASSRSVRVPEIGTDPDSDKIDARRDSVQVITTYRGELPEQIDIISYSRSGALSAGQEYVMGVYKSWIPESEYSSGKPWQAPFDQEILDAAGGEAYAYNSRMVWIIDDGIALRVSNRHMIWGGDDDTSHIEIGRQDHFRMPLKQLEAALRP